MAVLASAVGRNGLQSRMGIAHLRDVPRSAPLDAQHRTSPKTGETVSPLAPGALLPGRCADPSGAAPLRPLTDREILAQPFRLSDAQELVARTVGFERWDALRRGSHFVTLTRTGAL